MISGTGALAKTGSDTLTLTGANSYSGGTQISAGTLSGNTTSLQGSIVDDATLNFNQASSGAYLGNISGAGALTKTGNGTLTLAGSSYTYGGGTTVSAGRLRGNANSLQGDITNNAQVEFDQAAPGTYAGVISGTGSLFKFGSAVLTFTGANNYSGGTTVHVGTLRGNTTSLQGNIEDNATVEFNQGSAGTYSGIISGTGSLTKTGASMTTLTGANTYTGGTTVSAGTLRGDTTSLQGNIVDNANVEFNQASAGTFSGGVSGTGSITKAGASTLTLTGTNTYSGGTTIAFGTLEGSTTSLQGDFDNNGNLLFNQATDATFGGAVSGSGILAKIGTGKLTLTNATNTYSGGTQIGNGALAISSNDRLGPGTVSLLGVGGSLQTTAAMNLPQDFNLGSGGGSVDTAGNDVTLNGVISGVGNFDKAGNGTLALASTNNYGGTTSISGGTLAIGAADRLGSSAPLMIAGGATLRTTGAMTLTAAIDLTGGTGTIDTNGNNVTFSGQLNGTGSLTKSGTGTLALTSNNAYSGGTTIANGTLAITATNRLGAGNVTIDGGATLRADAGFTLTKNVALSGGTGSIDTGGNSFTASGVISGPGTLAKTGANTLTLSANNTYTGGTTVSAGTLRGTAGSIRGNVTNSAVLEFNQNSSGTFSNVISGTGSVTKAGTATLTLSGANTYSGGTTVSTGTLQGTTTSLQGDIVDNAGVVFNQAGDGTYGGVLSGAGTLTKADAGKVTLSGTNTYNGLTTVSGGILSVTGAIANSSVSVDGGVGATLAGTGTTGPVTVSGTVAPGTSVGTLDTGDAIFNSGSQYDVEIDAGGGADRLNVTGSADLGNASLDLGLEPGYNHVAGTVYTIVQASGAISGTFDGPAQIDVDDHRFEVVYQPSSVVLIARRAAPGLTADASADVALGGQVSDRGGLAGGLAPTGDITFRLYGPGDSNCSGSPVFTDTKAVSGNGDYESASFTPTEAGTYRWTASYSGDGDNDAAAVPCNAAGQSVTVTGTTPPPDPPDPPVDPTLQITSVELDRKAGTATIAVLSNTAGQVHISKSNKVKANGPATLGEDGTAELEVAPRNEAAKTLKKKGRLSVNPKVILNAADGVELLARQEFDLRRN